MKKVRNIVSMDQSMKDIDETFEELDVIEKKYNNIPPLVSSPDVGVPY